MMEEEILLNKKTNFFNKAIKECSYNIWLKDFRGDKCNYNHPSNQECYSCIYQDSCLKALYAAMAKNKEVLKIYLNRLDTCNSITARECEDFNNYNDDCEVCRKVFKKEFLMEYVELTDVVKEYLSELGVNFFTQGEIKSEEIKAKNFEKHIDGLLDAIYNDRFCSFTEDVAKIPFSCSADTCDDCKEYVRNWLLSDYKPVVDWSKVSIDTPVYISLGEGMPELRRYFAFYDKEEEKCYVFAEGRTSWTIPEDTDLHEYIKNKSYRKDDMYIMPCYSCRLAREEDIKKCTI